MKIKLRKNSIFMAQKNIAILVILPLDSNGTIIIVKRIIREIPSFNGIAITKVLISRVETHFYLNKISNSIAHEIVNQCKFDHSKSNCMHIQKWLHRKLKSRIKSVVGILYKKLEDRMSVQSKAIWKKFLYWSFAFGRRDYELYSVKIGFEEFLQATDYGISDVLNDQNGWITFSYIRLYFDEICYENYSLAETRLKQYKNFKWKEGLLSYKPRQSLSPNTWNKVKDWKISPADSVHKLIKALNRYSAELSGNKPTQLIKRTLASLATDTPSSIVKIVSQTSSNDIITMLKKYCRYTHDDYHRNRLTISNAISFLIDYVCHLENTPPTKKLHNLFDDARKWHEEQDRIRQVEWAKHQEHLIKTLEHTKYPANPFPQLPSQFTYIDTGIRLYHEGIDMHHCISYYNDTCLKGDAFMYHVDYKGETASIQITPKLYVVQSYGPHNRVNKASRWARQQVNKLSNKLSK